MSETHMAAMPAVGQLLLPAAARRDSTGSTEVRVAGRYLYMAAPSGGTESLGEGVGAGLSICYKSTTTRTYGDDIVLVFMMEQSEHEDVNSNSALYRRILAGFRWLDPMGVNFETYLALGAGYHMIEVSGGDDASGTGAYVGVGAEFLISTPMSFYLEALLHAFWADQTNAEDGQVASAALGVAVRF
jgi:hypothetical protein